MPNLNTVTATVLQEAFDQIDRTTTWTHGPTRDYLDVLQGLGDEPTTATPDQGGFTIDQTYERMVREWTTTTMPIMGAPATIDFDVRPRAREIYGVPIMQPLIDWSMQAHEGIKLPKEEPAQLEMF